MVYSEEGRLATVLNGKLIGLAANADPRMGYICLQSEGVPAEFRNIKIRRHAPKHAGPEGPAEDHPLVLAGASVRDARRLALPFTSAPRAPEKR